MSLLTNQRGEMMKKDDYRITKIELSQQDIPVEKSRAGLKTYVAVFLLIFFIFFFSAFAVLIAIAAMIIFYLVLFFKKLAQKGEEKSSK